MRRGDGRLKVLEFCHKLYDWRVAQCEMSGAFSALSLSEYVSQEAGASRGQLPVKYRTDLAKTPQKRLVKSPSYHRIERETHLLFDFDLDFLRFPPMNNEEESQCLATKNFKHSNYLSSTENPLCDCSWIRDRIGGDS